MIWGERERERERESSLSEPSFQTCKNQDCSFIGFKAFLDFGNAFNVQQNSQAFLLNEG